MTTIVTEVTEATEARDRDHTLCVLFTGTPSPLASRTAAIVSSIQAAPGDIFFRAGLGDEQRPPSVGVAAPQHIGQQPITRLRSRDGVVANRAIFLPRT